MSTINLTMYFSMIILSALEFHMSVPSQAVTVMFQNHIKGIMDAAGQSKHQQLISKLAHYITRVLSIVGGGRGKLPPPQSTQLLPQKKSSKRKREEREGGGGERILFGYYDNACK